MNFYLSHLQNWIFSKQIRLNLEENFAKIHCPPSALLALGYQAVGYVEPFIYMLIFWRNVAVFYDDNFMALLWHKQMIINSAWWRYDLETLSTLLALCEGKPSVTDGLS